ncbi:MAG: NFACT family protein, partial [Lawsonibacter sp.]
MPLDALCLSGLVYELQTALVGAKIDKIHQPGRDEVVMALRAGAGNVKLLLSANPSHPRPQLTELARENPDVPPMFCMRLRKHLTGGRILEITQPPLERVVEFRIEALDELGDRVERRLVLEAMGRHSNLILLDGEGRIMDCLRRVDGDMSARRQVLPGLFYHLPPVQEKLDPTALSREELEQRAAEATGETRADQWLLDTFGGLSPLICRELAQQAGGAVDVRLADLGPVGR